MATKVFINLPVKNLPKTIEFFTKVGYTFNPQFTDDTATCMIISEEIYAMLLTEERFKGFIKKEVADASGTAEVIIALSADSREAVDELVNKAMAAGASVHNEKQDHGFMYGWGFQDIDGHLWEVFYMDPNYVQGNNSQ